MSQEPSLAKNKAKEAWKKRQPKYRHVLKVKNAGLRYRSENKAGESAWVLRDISFRLRKGETLGVIGRNGAGKSSLLRMLAGIVAPDQGEIDRDNHNAILLSLSVGFVGHLTGRQNVIMSGMLLGLARKQVEEKMEQIIRFSELEGAIDKPLRTYSTGMRARLGFSVAINANADILLLDEVLGVGDQAFKVKSKRAMRRRIQSRKSVVLVSHSMSTISDLCDRVMWIEDGRVRNIGPTESVIADYLRHA